MDPGKTVIKRITDNLEEIVIDVEFTYHPGTPGRYSGPPEYCYPAEPGEIEIVSARVRGTGERVELTDGEIAEVEGEAERYYSERVFDDYEPDDDKDIADYWIL